MSDDFQGPDFSRGEGLLPVIAQDAASGDVLMLAYMNEEAYAETVRSGRAVYFSRSRRRLWRKGEESGHVQHVREILVDCDADTILLKVDQEGVACHEGYRSCFFRRLTPAGVELVGRRLIDPAEVYKGSAGSVMIERDPPPWRRVPRRTRALRWGMSGIYLLFLARLLAGITRTGMLPCLAVVLFAFLLTFGVGLYIAVGWALADRGRPQFRLSTLLCVTGLMAFYLATGRWIVGTIVPPDSPTLSSAWILILVFLSIWLVISLPFGLMLGDSVLEMAVWFVHRPWVRKWLLRRYSRG